MLCGCYRRGEANDPKIYAAAVAAVLAEYPREVIDFVTDPRTGVPSKIKWLPTLAELHEACEDHCRPNKFALEWESSARKQLAERAAIALEDMRPKLTYEELQRRCAADGLYIGDAKPDVNAVDIGAFREKFSISKEQWDAIPDAIGGR